MLKDRLGLLSILEIDINLGLILQFSADNRCNVCDMYSKIDSTLFTGTSMHSFSTKEDMIVSLKLEFFAFFPSLKASFRKRGVKHMLLFL